MAITLRNCSFAFKCDKSWTLLEKTKDASIRFCTQCQKEIHYCDNDEELVQSIALNRCVAIQVKNHLRNDDVVVVGMMIQKD